MLWRKLCAYWMPNCSSIQSFGGDGRGGLKCVPSARMRQLGQERTRVGMVDRQERGRRRRGASFSKFSFSPSSVRPGALRTSFDVGSVTPLNGPLSTPDLVASASSSTRTPLSTLEDDLYAAMLRLAPSRYIRSTLSRDLGRDFSAGEMSGSKGRICEVRFVDFESTLLSVHPSLLSPLAAWHIQDVHHS